MGATADTVREGVQGWLDRFELLVTDADVASQVSLAQAETRWLIRAERAQLAEHEAGEDGRCRRCSRRRKTVAFPCSVWLTAYKVLVINDVTVSAPGRRRGRHAW